MLDVHPLIRCGPETRVIQDILRFKSKSLLDSEARRLNAAGLSSDVLDSAIRVFIETIIHNAGKPAHMLCNKDPFLFIHLSYLAQIFPEAKFIHMVRDGRAVMASIKK